MRSPPFKLTVTVSNNPGVSSEHGPRLAILISYNLICPPFLPDFGAVRFIQINEAKFHRMFEFSELPFELISRDFILMTIAFPAFNKNTTFVEVEIMICTFEITSRRAECCVTY